MGGGVLETGAKTALGANLQEWLFPIVFLAAITVLIGLGAGPMFRFALQAVMGGAP